MKNDLNYFSIMDAMNLLKIYYYWHHNFISTNHATNLNKFIEIVKLLKNYKPPTELHTELEMYL